MQAFLDHGEDFVVRDTLAELVDGMNAHRPRGPGSTPTWWSSRSLARDREVGNSYSKDFQLMAIAQRPPRASATGSRASPSRTGCSTPAPAR